MGKNSDLDDFVRKYTPLALAKVRSFLSRNQSVNYEWFYDDLRQSAFEGIVEAYHTFDKSVGVPETAYISLKIEYAILQEFDRLNHTDSRKIARMTRVNQYKAVAEQIYDTHITDAQFAEFVGETEESLKRLYDTCVVSVCGLSAIQGSEQSHIEREDNDSLLNTKEVKILLQAAINILPPRQQNIIELLYRQGMTLEKAGATLGIRKQSIAKARDRIIAKLRVIMSENNIEF